jgi:hypothetical protein
MNDPFGSMKGFVNQFRGFIQNPASLFSQRGIPQNALQNPQAAVQQLMNSGRMSQQDFNQLQNMANRIMNNPLFGQFFGNK